MSKLLSWRSEPLLRSWHWLHLNTAPDPRTRSLRLRLRQGNSLVRAPGPRPRKLCDSVALATTRTRTTYTRWSFRLRNHGQHVDGSHEDGNYQRNHGGFSAIWGISFRETENCQEEKDNGGENGHRNTDKDGEKASFPSVERSKITCKWLSLSHL